MGNSLTSLLSLFEKHILSGIPSNASWDLIKSVYKRLTERDIQELFVDAFVSTVKEEKERLSKYVGDADDEIDIDREVLKRILNQNLDRPINETTLSTISTEKFILRLTEELTKHHGLILGDFNRSYIDYEHIVLNIARKARSKFVKFLYDNQDNFQIFLLQEAKLNNSQLIEIEKFLEDRFYLTLDLLKTQILLLSNLEEQQEIITDGVERIISGQNQIKEMVSRIQPSSLLRYFINLQEYLSLSDRGFPKLIHYEYDLVYFPIKILNKIMNKLIRDKRCVLVGSSAAGKTVIGISIGYLLSKSIGYEVYYLNSDRSFYGDGREWYRTIKKFDNQKSLFIIDNCHLSIDDTSEFCLQMEGNPAKNASVILISRPEINEIGREYKNETYFDYWAKHILFVKSEDIYDGIIEHYKNKYLINDNKYLDFNTDSKEIIKKQHSHNLIISKARLDTWKKVGGRLSEVSIEDVYKSLNQKYLLDSPKTIATLCVFWQYEIPIHCNFVEKELNSKEVGKLIEDRTLGFVESDENGYVYILDFHPDEAREIFRAYYYRYEGIINENDLKSDIFNIIKEYLLKAPPNFVTVYHNLYTHGEEGLQNSLLKDHELQNCAKNEFLNNRLPGNILYLYALNNNDSHQSTRLIHQYLRMIGGISIFVDKLMQYKAKDIHFVIYALSKIDKKILHKLKVHLDPILLSKKLSEDILSAASVMVILGSYGYSKSKINTFFENLDINKITDNFINIFLAESPRRDGKTKALNSLRSLSSIMKKLTEDKKTQIINKIPFSIFISKVYEFDVDSISSYCEKLYEINASIGERVITEVDFSKLLSENNYEEDQFRRFISFFKTKSQNVTNEILKKMKKDKLIDFTKDSSDISFVNFLQEVGYKNIIFALLTGVTEGVIFQLLSQSDLRIIGIFFKNNYHYNTNLYNKFLETLFIEKLQDTSIREIHLFCNQISLIRDKGKYLVCEIIYIILKNNISLHNRNTKEIEKFINFLTLINEYQALELKNYIISTKNLLSVLHSCDVENIVSMLNYAVEEDNFRWTRKTRPKLKEAFLSYEIKENIHKNNLYYVSNLLIFIHCNIDKEIGKCLARKLDNKVKPTKISKNINEDLLTFLWNIISIGELSESSVLYSIAKQKNIQRIEQNNIGRELCLHGLINMLYPEKYSKHQIKINKFSKEKIQNWLVKCINDDQIVNFSLTLRSMLSIDSRQYKDILVEVKEIWEYDEIWEDMDKKVETPLLIRLIRDTRQIISEVLFEQTINEIDQLISALEI